MKFELLQKDINSQARAGTITTDHGVIETPIFMPVGTVASVKGVHQRELKNDINPDKMCIRDRFIDGHRVKNICFVFLAKTKKWKNKQ